MSRGSAPPHLHCPACGRTTVHTVLFEKNGCDVLRCTVCRLGRAAADSFDPRTYYMRDYFAGGRPDGYADYAGSEPVLRREFARAVAFVRTVVPGGRLLEIGCAYGFFLAEAAPHYDVTGVEIGEEAAAAARRSGLRVITGPADETTLGPLGEFDVIVLLDVVEHLPDPYATLALCVERLRRGGAIVLTTGDFGSPLARLLGARWRLMTPPQHLWFFTTDAMRGVADRLGLEVERVDHPRKLVPWSLLAHQVRRMLGRPPRDPVASSTRGVPVNLYDAMRVVLRKPF